MLEPRASVENCAKKLFSSPGTKGRFTRHPSLIKLAKSIQEDRRKISSAPSSPLKSPPGESSPPEGDLSVSSPPDGDHSRSSSVLKAERLCPGDPSGNDFPNKMAQLAAICQIELDQEEA